jgi:hypothetical protein
MTKIIVPFRNFAEVLNNSNKLLVIQIFFVAETRLCVLQTVDEFGRKLCSSI